MSVKYKTKITNFAKDLNMHSVDKNEPMVDVTTIQNILYAMKCMDEGSGDYKTKSLVRRAPLSQVQRIQSRKIDDIGYLVSDDFFKKYGIA